MELLQLTNHRFEEGVPVRVVRVDSLTTIWVRLLNWPRLTQILNLEMLENPMAYLPKAKNLEPGMLVAVRANFESANFWDRAIILQQTATGYIVLFVDWGIQTHLPLNSIRLLPRKCATMAPWARKIRLQGVRDQAIQGVEHRMAAISMLKRTGCLVNIDSSPGEAMSARLLLDWESEGSPKDVAEHWLERGYVDAE